MMRVNKICKRQQGKSGQRYKRSAYGKTEKNGKSFIIKCIQAETLMDDDNGGGGGDDGVRWGFIYQHTHTHIYILKSLVLVFFQVPGMEIQQCHNVCYALTMRL
jgi:hypothetical protein